MTKPMPFELYACTTPNVLKIMFMLAELDLPYRTTHVRIHRAEHFAEGFERLHPYRKLPVLIDPDGPDGQPHRVFESGAILFYLAEKTGRLMGTGLAQRSEIMQWTMLQMSSVGPTYGNATHFARIVSGEDYSRRRFVTQAIRLCQVYDARLAESEFLAGDQFSIADVATFPWLWKHPAMVRIDPDNYPNLRRWVELIEARPAFKAAQGVYREIVDVDRADAAVAIPDNFDRFLGRGRWFLTD